MVSLNLADPEFQMWMHIGFGLAVFAGATLLWVLFNRSRAKKSSRRGSFSQYGTMTQEEKYRNEKGRREKVGSSLPKLWENIVIKVNLKMKKIKVVCLKCCLRW